MSLYVRSALLGLLPCLVNAVLGPPQLSAQEAPPIPLALLMTTEGELGAVLARDQGLLLPDGQGDWRLMCSSAFGLAPSGITYRGLRPSGQILFGTYRGLRLADPSGCEVGVYELDDLAQPNIVAIDRLDDTLYTLVSVQGEHALYTGEEFGSRFDHEADLGEGIFLELRVAPSQPQRIYFYGAEFDADAGVSTRVLYRTDDGGQTLQRFELPFQDERYFALLAVDPRDPDRLYASFATPAESHSHPGEMHQGKLDQLVVTEDGGESFRVLRELPAFGGFTLGSEAGELWLGDGEGGLLRSGDYGEQFETVKDSLHLSCVQRFGDRLWVCADSTRDPFSVGYSDDGGKTFEAVMRFNDVVGPLLCDGRAQQDCQRSYAGFEVWHHASVTPDAQTDGGAGSGTGADAPPDAGMDAGEVAKSDAGFAAEPTSNDGCSCRAPGSDREVAAPEWLLWPLALWSLHRARPRWRSPRRRRRR